MLKRILFLLCLLQSLQLCAQDTIQLKIEVYYKQRPLVLDSMFYWYNDQPISFSSLKFYLTNIGYIASNGQLSRLSDRAYLIDASDKASLTCTFTKQDSTPLKAFIFTLGTDSLTNVAGLLDGDLSPLKGMYWTWQSGYINFKLEGYSPYCATRKNKFQYHLGGYLPPLATAQRLMFNLPDSTSSKIRLLVNLEQLMQSVDLKQQPVLMSPGLKAVEISKKVTKVFVLDAS